MNVQNNNKMGLTWQSLLVGVLLVMMVPVFSACKQEKPQPEKNKKSANAQVQGELGKEEEVTNRHLASGIAVPPHIPKAPIQSLDAKTPKEVEETSKILFYDVNTVSNSELVPVIKKAIAYQVLSSTPDTEFMPESPIKPNDLKQWLFAKQEPLEKPLLKKGNAVDEKTEIDLKAKKADEKNGVISQPHSKASDPAIKKTAEKAAGKSVLKPEAEIVEEKPKVIKPKPNVAYLERLDAGSPMTRSQLCELYASIKGVDRILSQKSGVTAQYPLFSNWQDAELISEKSVPSVVYSAETGMIKAVFLSGKDNPDMMYRFHPSSTVTRAEALRFVIWLDAI